mgnify:FL=1
MSSKGSYHEYFTVIYRTDSSGESHRVVLLNDNAKHVPEPVVKKKPARWLSEASQGQSPVDVINMPLFEFNPYRRKR